MTVQNLIDALSAIDHPNDEVQIFDPDGGDWFPVTGFTYAGGPVQLYADTDEQEISRSSDAEELEK